TRAAQKNLCRSKSRVQTKRKKMMRKRTMTMRRKMRMEERKKTMMRKKILTCEATSLKKMKKIVNFLERFCQIFSHFSSKDLPSASAWGKKRSSFYDTDYVDQDYGGFSGSDAEEAETEENEAKRIQKESAAAVRAEDFFLDEEVFPLFFVFSGPEVISGRKF